MGFARVQLPLFVRSGLRQTASDRGNILLRFGKLSGRQYDEISYFLRLCVIWVNLMPAPQSSQNLLGRGDHQNTDPQYRFSAVRVENVSALRLQYPCPGFELSLSKVI